MSTSTVFGGATLVIFLKDENSVETYTIYKYFCPGPPATPLHLWPHVRGGVVSTAFGLQVYSPRNKIIKQRI